MRSSCMAWPQFERGFPTDCKTDIDRVSSELVDSLYDIMPSAALIGHQWRRHGSCSGFRQEDYFATLRQARRKSSFPLLTDVWIWQRP